MKTLAWIDGRDLEAETRQLLRPGEAWKRGSIALPRFFFEVGSWEEAKKQLLTPHFKLSELMMVDCREERRLRENFSHYVPGAILLLAFALETFRREAEAPVFVSANGGYRSPSHQLSSADNPHCWGTAANIYRVGQTYLDHEESISKYARLARTLSPAVRIKPYVAGDDHLHLDLGLVNVSPPKR